MFAYFVSSLLVTRHVALYSLYVLVDILCLIRFWERPDIEQTPRIAPGSLQ